MSWSLKLENGDFTLAGAKYGTVTGEEKLLQDLRCYILEKMGTDDMHPGYGSLIDGGRMPNGQEVNGVLGLPNRGLAHLRIDAEIRRIVQDYQATQLARAKSDFSTYGKTTLSRGEVLLSLQGVEFVPIQDTVFVRITLLSGNRTNFSLDLTFPNSNLI